MRELPRPFERYKHFKGREYQVLMIAKNEKTMEDMVIYQALYEPYQIYAREAGDFLSAVDKEKYPNATQDERFKLIEDEKRESRTEAVRPAEPAVSTEAPRNPEPVRAAVSAPVQEEKREEPEYANNGVDPVLMRFLDAEEGHEQLKVLEECAGKITEQILTPMELSLGMEPSTESLDERIRNIRNNITTRMKYEIRR